MAMSLGCSLVQLSDGRKVLIDSGYPVGWDASQRFPTLRIEDSVVNALARLSLTPDDIDILITTHVDPDHASSNDAFPNTEIVTQRAAYDAARGGKERAAITRQHWDTPNLRYRLVDGDAELLPGIELISTPGHAPGHQSVMVHLPNTGTVLLAIDAVALASAFTPDRAASPMDLDPPAAIQSTIRLLDLAQQEQVDLVVFGHDGAQWAALRTAPEFYDQDVAISGMNRRTRRRGSATPAITRAPLDPSSLTQEPAPCPSNRSPSRILPR